jgi:hypothetical protein
MKPFLLVSVCFLFSTADFIGHIQRKIFSIFLAVYMIAVTVTALHAYRVLYVVLIPTPSLFLII